MFTYIFNIQKDDKPADTIIITANSFCKAIEAYSKAPIDEKKYTTTDLINGCHLLSGETDVTIVRNNNEVFRTSDFGIAPGCKKKINECKFTK